MSQYRPDIDGLRAVAVLPVLLLHAFPTVLPGGYVGVDVFFVISGYLITGILLNEVAQGTFSVRRFYVRRARRLFPALFVVLLAVFAFGWVALLPNEFTSLGKHELAGAAFVSNIALWREQGYFDVGSKLKPLLHLWSLGVEEQYYLLWPLLVSLLARRRHAFWIAAALLGLASFALNVLWIEPWPTLTFYLLLTRFWELLVGGIFAFGSRGRAAKRQSDPVAANGLAQLTGASLRSHALSIVGLLSIAIAIVRFDHGTSFPDGRRRCPSEAPPWLSRLDRLPS